MSKRKKSSPSSSSLPNQAINAYTESADPLGSYTGLTEDMRCMPRLRVRGKRGHRDDDTPVQDADDL